MSVEISVEEKELSTQLVKRLKVISSDYAPHEILKKGLRGKRWEYISTDKILMDVVINDARHVQDLSKSIFGEGKNEGFGQISPTNVAAFMDEKENEYYMVTDGFHRTDAFLQEGEPQIDSIVLYGLTLEEVYDLRVLAANSVKSTGFARVIEFMQKSFEQTSWYKEKGLTLLQAFSLCNQNSSGVRLQLEGKEAKDLKNWGLEKAHFWGRTPGSIFQMLLIASKADPELVRKVRVGIGGGRGVGYGIWNPARLKAVTDIIPHKHRLQQMVYQAVVQYDLVSEETQKFTKVVAYFDNIEEPDIVELVCANAQVVATIAETLTNPESIKNTLLIGMYHNLTSEDIIQLADVIKIAGDDDELKDQIYQDPKKFMGQLDLNAKSIDSLKDNKAGLKQKKYIGALDKNIFNDSIDSDKTGGYSISHTTIDLEKQIDCLEEALKQSQEKNGGSSWRSRKRSWWKTISGLSVEERKAFEMLFIKKIKIEDVAKQLNMTENRIARMVFSGVNRYFVAEKDQLLDIICKNLFSSNDGRRT